MTANHCSQDKFKTKMSYKCELAIIYHHDEQGDQIWFNSVFKQFKSYFLTG